MITIEHIKQKDLPDLAKLYELLSRMASDIQKMEKIYALLIKNPHYFLLGAYSKENKLVGTIMGLLCYDLVFECQPIMFMENMVVDRNYQNKGVGKKLLSRLEEIAKEHDCLFIEFCSSMFRKEAHGFYESMGYKNDAVKGYRKFFRDIKLQESLKDKN
jgi:GNAT superfamily N-acetyltransferase